jgi:predicted amidohydrolase YtcJ
MADRSNPKGRVLEDAVEAIERAILATDPDMVNRTIRVQARKRIAVQGVTHVIDL